MLWRIQDILVIDVYHQESSTHALFKIFIHCVMASNRACLKWKEQWTQKRCLSETKNKTTKKRTATIDIEAICTQRSHWVKLQKRTLEDYIFITKFKISTLHVFFSIILPRHHHHCHRTHLESDGGMWFTPHASLLVHLTLTGRAVMQ